MRRRDFIICLGSAAAWPIVARAQKAEKVYRLVFVNTVDLADWRTDPHTLAFLEEMRRRGWNEGVNFIAEYSSRSGRTLAEMARDTVRSRPDAIITWDFRTAINLKEVTTSIPIVAMVADPIEHGLAVSLSRPGGNFTGLYMQLELTSKYIDLLKELHPETTKIAYLTPTDTWSSPFSQKLKAFAAEASISLIGPGLESPITEAEYRRVFAEMLKQRPDALIVSGSSDHYAHRPLILELVSQARLPTLYPYQFWANEGGLMAYSQDTIELFRSSAEFVDKIFKGANPAEMPFQGNARYKLILNLKTAKTLGITFPLTLLGRADEVIE